MILFLPSAFAQIQAGDIVSQTQIDAVDVNSFNLQYQQTKLFLTLKGGEWDLRSRLSFLTIIPIGDFDVNGEQDGVEDYEIVREQFVYSSGQDALFDFVDCAIASNFINIISCFQTHIEPIFDSQLANQDFLHRRYLTSLQTGGAPVVPEGLQEYWST